MKRKRKKNNIKQNKTKNKENKLEHINVYWKLDIKRM